jgi:hypothetical protein
MIIGTGTAINAQRYRDSVTSLQSALQEQFYEVANVDNQRPKSASCGGSVNEVGQSNCVILGRYITPVAGQSLSIKSVLGHLDIDETLSQNDVSAFQQYNPQISPIPADSYEIEWGSLMAKPGTNSDLTFSMLILRSPVSGAIRTFIDPHKIISDNNINRLLSVVPSALNKSVKICLNSNGLATGVRMAVLVDANATGPNAVEVLGDNSGC